MIRDLDSLVDQRPLSVVELDSRFFAFSELWALLKAKYSQLVQSQIAKDEDAKSGFFHASIKSRSRINVILALKVGDRWVEGVATI